MTLKHLAILLSSVFLFGCGCYETRDAAWNACNDKYNGKCSYLGDDFKVCSPREDEKALRQNFPNIQYNNKNSKFVTTIAKPESSSEPASETFPVTDYERAQKYRRQGKNYLAFSLLLKEAQSGHIGAMNDTGFAYSQGVGVTQDDELATYWYRKGAESGDDVAQKNYGLRLFNGLGTKRDLVKAVNMFRLAAEYGNSDAQNNLANRYRRGEGVLTNLKKAKYWYEKSASQNNKYAQASLAHFYKKDNPKYLSLLTKAALNGDVNSMFNLGLYYKNDSNSPKNAIKWFMKASDNGDIESRLMVAKIFEHTLGDNKSAYLWYQKLALAGNIEAMYSLGVFFNKGRYVTKDLCKAVQWYEMSALKGFAPAQHNLANRYASGECVPQSDQKAQELYNAAAKKGFKLSINALKKI